MKATSLWFFFFGVPTDGAVTGTVDVSASPAEFSGTGSVISPEQTSGGASWSVRGARPIIRPKPTTGRVWVTLDVVAATASMAAIGDVERPEIGGTADLQPGSVARFAAHGDVRYSDDDEVLLVVAA